MRTPDFRQKWLYAIAFSLTCLLLVLLRQYNPKETVEHPLPSGDINARKVLSKTNFQNDVSRQLTPIERSVSNDLKRLTAARERSRDQWRSPIEFYGKVVDDKGAPVEGANILFSCNDLSREGVSSYRTKSDSGGSFSIIGIQGKLLLVGVFKDGYYTIAQSSKPFFYSDSRDIFIPDISNPVVFQLRKMGKPESLIRVVYPEGMQTAKLKPDGTPTMVNLLGARPDSVENGQLKLSFFRKENPKDRRFSYELRLTIPGGGLVETNDKFLFDAPPEGYASVVQLLVPEDSKGWRLSLERRFYIKLPNGTFGSIKVFFYAHNGVFTVRSAVNPSGSRNLEGAGN